MARIDDYESARRIAVQSLSEQSFQDVVARCGFEPDGPDGIRAPFLDRIYRIHPPSFAFTDIRDENKKIPIQEQILILHYLMADVPVGFGNWISYREIPGAAFYWGAFVKRAINPLKTVFGQHLASFSAAAAALKGVDIDTGDAACEIRVFPHVPMQLILWKGDDEFPPEANIIFSESIGRILSPEDVAWMAGMVAYRMIALARE